jgi:ribosomal protein S18 acetylase RimI-like enzyme
VAEVERATTRAQAQTAGAVLGRAFATDPLWAWLLGGRGQEEQRLARVFTALARSAVRTDGAQVLTAADRTGAALWLPPGSWKAPPLDVLRSGPQLTRALGRNVLRALRVLAAVERQHPPQPHWYLEALGVVPQVRSRGIGPTLLRPVLDRCDAERVPAYLESSNARNVPFYERHGFVARAPLDVPAGCPVLTPMWREPQEVTDSQRGEKRPRS